MHAIYCGGIHVFLSIQRIGTFGLEVVLFFLELIEKFWILVTADYLLGELRMYLN